jgi:uncharacterized RDD family membrane protein YckC
MDQNPYTPPQAPLAVPTVASGPVLYAKLGIRIRAFLIDYFLLLGSFLITAIVGVSLRGIPGAGAVLFVAWVLLAVFYEPVMVWQTGGTLGHHAKNICVVSERTGGHPSLPAALVRSLTKSILGWLSFLFILSSDRQQALHDAIAGVTVRIKDKKLALRRDYVRGPGTS